MFLDFPKSGNKWDSFPAVGKVWVKNWIRLKLLFWEKSEKVTTNSTFVIAIFKAGHNTLFDSGKLLGPHFGEFIFLGS